MKFRNITILIIGLLFFQLQSCDNNFLEVKPDQKMVVPSSLKDFQALLDNTAKMNVQMAYLIETASDDFYLTYDRYSSISVENDRLAHIWSVTPNYSNKESQDWNNRYEQIFYANIVLDNVDKASSIGSTSTLNADILRGSALFYRAWGYWQLSQMFCKPYSSTADIDLGLPLRLSADINDKTVRSTVSATYKQIIKDLNESIGYLPHLSTIVTRPSKAASYALLSRVYLAMADYVESAKMAESCLMLKNDLIDYKTINSTLNYPIQEFNQEVIFHSSLQSGLSLRENRLMVDSNLYDAYDVHDLRKKVFFYDSGGVRYKGSYSGKQEFFCGLSTNEVLLNYVESLTRIGKFDEAILSIHKLLKNRYASDFVISVPNDQNKILDFILLERRKELIFRGLRWTDLRRLNQDVKYQKTIKRVLNNVVYTLEPNSNKYVFPIPQKVVDISGIDQNP